MSKWLRGFLQLHMLLVASALSLVAAFLLRFDFAIPAYEFKFLQLGLCVFVPVRCVVFCGFRLHRITWRLVSLVDGALFKQMGEDAFDAVVAVNLWVFTILIKRQRKPGSSPESDKK